MQTTLKNNIIKVHVVTAKSYICIQKRKCTTLKYTNVCYKIATIKYLKHFCKQKKTETYM